jgi:hypothetical protein
MWCDLYNVMFSDLNWHDIWSGYWLSSCSKVWSSYQSLFLFFPRLQNATKTLDTFSIGCCPLISKGQVGKLQIHSGNLRTKRWSKYIWRSTYIYIFLGKLSSQIDLSKHSHSVHARRQLVKYRFVNKCFPGFSALKCVNLFYCRTVNLTLTRLQIEQQGVTKDAL